MWVLPQSDHDCFREAALLACALIGADPVYLDANFQLLEHYSASARTDPHLGVEHVSAHLRHHDRDGTVREGWAQVRADLSGRLYDAPPPDTHWRDIDIDLTRTPARDRLAALAPRALRIDDENLTHLQTFIRNAVTVTTAAPPLGAGLLALARELRVGALARPGMDPHDLIDAQQQRLITAVWEQRELGRADGALAADVLTAVMLGAAAAQDTGIAEWARYLAEADTYLTTARPISPLIERAVRDGHQSIVEQLATGFLSAGEQRRDAALDQPTYDRGGFAKALYDAYPYLHAARTLAAALVAVTGEQAHRRTLQVADEWAVRVVDGLFHQWFDLDGTILSQERAVLAAAVAAGDRRRVRSILLHGETALLRPRSARAHLLPTTKGDT
ncbi:hypothetical protein [Nocardia coubleae]|uniref:Uncharacterized protein n=1 Tax=Nocardia coubleae TaxID=356147 RepID=A0A846W113_9NOCA|nr:hypothetical protein [Nocardia coubleae]NKX86367.1 hypothetical protein [Nocardia coubleae]